MRILITGAGRAIGLATAVELAERGHSVVATARDPSTITTHPNIEAAPLDVTDDDSVRACIDASGPLDVVINNAALSAHGPMEDFPLDRIRAAFETNVIGALRVTQAVVPGFRAAGSGLVVNVSSVQGQVGTPLEGAYCSTKFALEALSETLHYELGHFGIGVLVVQPGYIAPGMKHAERHEGGPHYAELWDQWTGTDDKVTGGAGRTTSERAAQVIADAIEDPDRPLRIRIGDDANLILDTRKALGDADFESAMRASLDLTW